MSAGGIGLDIVEIDRIRKLAQKTPRFLSRVFTKEEISYCRAKKLPWQHFAVRFAAKEAVWKALGSKGVSLRDISVARGADGKPGVLLKGRPRPGILLSLSHGDHHALAVALRTR